MAGNQENVLKSMADIDVVLSKQVAKIKVKALANKAREKVSSIKEVKGHLRTAMDEVAKLEKENEELKR